MASMLDDVRPGPSSRKRRRSNNETTTTTKPEIKQVRSLVKNVSEIYLPQSDCIDTDADDDSEPYPWEVVGKTENPSSPLACGPDYFDGESGMDNAGFAEQQSDSISASRVSFFCCCLSF